MCYRDFVEWSIEFSVPELEETHQLREPWVNIQVLPDERLKDALMVWQPVEDLCGRQRVAFKLFKEVMICHLMLHLCFHNPRLFIAPV